jgi:putative glutathione S-transferase
MDEVNPWIYDNINNGVYKCGFAKSQAAYDVAVKDLFDSLDRLDALLAEKKFLTGDVLTLSDIRCWQTIVRFDEVYVVYFKTNVREISQYANIFRWCVDMWQIPGVKETTNMNHIKLHYYTSHPTLNHYAIVPKGPDFLGKLDDAVKKLQ